MNLGLQTFSFQGSNQPKITEKSGKDWVEYGEKNDYPDYLIDLVNSSSTHNAIVEGVAQLVYGKGLSIKGGNQRLSQTTRLKHLFDDMGEQHLKRFIHDYYLHGNAFLQVVYSKTKMPLSISCLPAETIRMDKVNEKGIIEGVWYSADWANYRRQANKPEFLEKLDPEKPGGTKVICLRNMRSGQFYYGQPKYIAGVSWIELDKRIANFHLNGIKNGLFPSLHFAFKSGVPTEEEQREINRKLKDKFGEDGEAERIITTFSANGEEGVEVKPIEVSDADKKYDFLSQESSKKVMISHRVTSPMLFGIKDGQGLGSNTDELRQSFMLYDSTVIEPLRQDVLRALKPIFRHLEIVAPVEFDSLQPVEFETKEEANAEKRAFSNDAKAEMTEEDEHAWLEYLEGKGEVVDEDEWELISEEAVTGTDEDFTKAFKFFDRYADPDQKSTHDTGLYKVRYSYAPKATSSNSRQFCIGMVSAAEAGVVYRKEDIDGMSAAGENGQFAPKGTSNYNIFLYKGGVNCHHYWTRKVFKRKRGKGGEFLPNEGLENDKNVSVNQARRDGVPLVQNPKDVAKRPVDMPNGGRLN